MGLLKSYGQFLRQRKAASMRNSSVFSFIFFHGTTEILTSGFTRLSMMRSGICGYRRSHSALSSIFVHDVTPGYSSLFSSFPWGARPPRSGIVGRLMTTIPDRWFTEPSYMLEWTSQSMCLRRFVSLPTNTTVTVESLRYLSLISRRILSSVQSSGMSPVSTDLSTNIEYRSPESTSWSLYH